MCDSFSDTDLIYSRSSLGWKHFSPTPTFGHQSTMVQLTRTYDCLPNDMKPNTIEANQTST
jgi:hypothetical protein